MIVADFNGEHQGSLEGGMNKTWTGDGRYRSHVGWKEDRGREKLKTWVDGREIG